jgi:hypothetical protein
MKEYFLAIWNGVWPWMNVGTHLDIIRVVDASTAVWLAFELSCLDAT